MLTIRPKTKLPFNKARTKYVFALKLFSKIAITHKRPRNVKKLYWALNSLNEMVSFNVKATNADVLLSLIHI